MQPLQWYVAAVFGSCASCLAAIDLYACTGYICWQLVSESVSPCKDAMLYAAEFAMLPAWTKLRHIFAKPALILSKIQDTDAYC